MKRLLVTVFMLSVTLGGVVLAADPHVSFGPAGDPIELPTREDVCQYGFTDTAPGSGWTLGLGQQLGINCAGAGCISAVGFYVEFTVTPGELDIVIYDNGVEVSRTTVPPGGVAPGVNEFDIADVNIAGDACIMLCPDANYWSVTGEDYASPPYGNSYFSNNCTCQNAFTDNNLTIWATLCSPTATESSSWGSVKTLYR
jgi:hypothetical protein